MEGVRKIPQVRFNTLQEFIEGNNNFYATCLDSRHSEVRRNNEAYKRFSAKYPRFSSWLLKKCFEIYSPQGYEKYGREWEKHLPWEHLFVAYKKMSELVYEGDKGYSLTG